MAWSRSSRHQRGYGSTWVRLRAQVLLRDGHLCQACLADGRYTTGNQVDHVKPKARGGSDQLANLQTLCAECHQAKTRRERWGELVRPAHVQACDIDGNPVDPRHPWNT